MVVFIVNEKQFPFNDTDTILEVKQSLVKQLNLSCKYVDLIFILDKPLRVMGKFNVEPGKLARTLDRYVLERFAFKETIKVGYEEVDGYDPDKRTPLISGGRGRGKGIGRGVGRGRGITSGVYVPPTRDESTFDHNSLEQSMKLEPVFDLDSHDDFPSL